jgi:hypothetical protein
MLGGVLASRASMGQRGLRLRVLNRTGGLSGLEARFAECRYELLTSEAETLAHAATVTR